MKADKKPSTAMPYLRNNAAWDTLNRVQRERQWLAQKNYIKTHITSHMAKRVRDSKTGGMKIYRTKNFPRLL